MNLRRVAHLLGVLALLVALGGCSETLEPTFCTGEAVPGLRVIVADAAAGSAVPGALVVAREGTFEDSAVTPASGQPVFLAYERAGSYQVEVTAEGYQDFGPVPVTVAADECHVRTEEVLATLEAAP